MIKLILFVVLAYIVYRFYIVPIKKNIDERRTKIIDDRDKNRRTKKEDDDDFIDYEEVK